MPGIFEIKNRLDGLKSINNITYAMQIVTISRLKRINAQLNRAKDSFRDLIEILRPLLEEDEKAAAAFFNPPLETKKPPVLFAFFSNRGFCGSFNQDLVRHIEQHFATAGLDLAGFDKVCVGKKASVAIRHWDQGKIKYYAPEKDTFRDEEIADVEKLVKMYMAEGRQIFGAFFEFKSIVTQHPKVERYYPLSAEALAPAIAAPANAVRSNPPFFWEPSKADVLEQLKSYYYLIKLIKMIRDSASSEFGQRFLLMKGAVDNVKELTDELTVELNKERQRMITQEISEIISTFKALQKDRS